MHCIAASLACNVESHDAGTTAVIPGLHRANMMAGANRFKFPTLSLLHNPGGQLEEGLIAPDQAHDALDAIAHACPLQHACNCMPCLFLHLRQ